MNSVDYKLGQIDASLKALAAAQTDIKATQTQQASDIAEIKAALAEKKGERRAAHYIAGGIGSVVMLILTVIGKKIGLLS